MNGLCGWIDSRSSAEALRDALERMAARLPHDGATAPRTNILNGAAIAVSGGTDRSCDRDGNRLAVITGEPRWLDDSLATIACNRNHAAALLKAHALFGNALFDKLAGTFAFALLDSGSGSALLAIDRMGIGQLCFGRTPDGGLVFATTTDSARCHPGIANEMSPQGVFNYLFHYVSPAPRTVFASLDKLEAGHYLEFSGGAAKTRRYWRLDYAPDSETGTKQLGEELVDTLRGAVRRSASGVDLTRAGAFLSGGLDSSTVTGMLAELTPEPTHTFTIGFDLEGYDESGFAEITARHFNTDHRLYYVTPADVFDLVPKIAQSFDEPFANSSAVPTYFCAKLAKENGVDTMFAGDGGDEIFCGNERYLDHRKYQWFLQSPALLRQLALTSAKFLPESVDIIRRARNHLNFLNTPLPDRLYYMVAQQSAAPTAFFEPDFIAPIDAGEPIQIARDLYGASDSDLDIVQRMMLMDQQLTLADNDLRKVNGACALAGIEVRYPFLDDALVALSGRIPPELHIRTGILRDFFKQSLRDFLPGEVITKPKHGFGLPLTHWLSDYAPLRGLCADAVMSFADRKIIRPGFAASLTDELAAGSRPELLSMCWDIMILELWLQARELTI